jgi:Beta-ketoacyl synthase, C-terminal domain/Beta-ketoacyl synthase, N-terminal domain
VAGYGCCSAAGLGVERFWQGLVEGRDHSLPLDTSRWPVKPPVPLTACTWAEESSSMQDRLVSRLVLAFQEINFHSSGKLGVIFSSSKGCVEDFIWSGVGLDSDPLTPCLKEFLKATEIHAGRSLCVSNACASSHSAIFLASQWLTKTDLTDVLVLAADGVGPFVVNGFRCLGALSTTRARPFAANRDGLKLGEAAAVLWLSRREIGSLRLWGAGVDVEGYAVTRSAVSGESLKRAISQAQGTRCAPDLIVAHGTGTLPNDAIEDQVFVDLFGPGIRVTATKGSIGHTLGASGLLDMIAASEALRRGRPFALANTEVIDESFGACYLTSSGRETNFTGPLQEALVTSLGFGGVHAGVRLGNVS